MRTQRQINKDLKPISEAIFNASGTAKANIEVNILVMKQLMRDLKEVYAIAKQEAEECQLKLNN